MKIRPIPDWQSKNLRCNFCDSTKSVKYTMEIQDPIVSSGYTNVCVCNKCVFRYMNDEVRVMRGINRRELLKELMKRFSFEKSHSFIQITNEDGEFKNDIVHIQLIGNTNGYRYNVVLNNCEYSLNKNL